MKAIKIIFYWGPVFLCAGVIFYFSSIPHLRSGLGIWDFILRKCAHMTEYALLVGLTLRAMKAFYPSKSDLKLLLWSITLCLLYACSDEFHQSFVAGRAGSVVDILVDFSGMLIFTLGYQRVKKCAK